MNMYGMNNLSNVFGGKIPGLKKPVLNDIDNINLTKTDDISNPFKSSSGILSGKRLGFDNTLNLLGNKNKNVVDNKFKNNNIEQKIFGNLKSNQSVQKSGFEQMLYGNRNNDKELWNKVKPRSFPKVDVYGRSRNNDINNIPVLEVPTQQQSDIQLDSEKVKKVFNIKPKKVGPIEVYNVTESSDTSDTSIRSQLLSDYLKEKEDEKRRLKEMQNVSVKTYGGPTTGEKVKKALTTGISNVGTGISNVGTAVGTGISNVGTAVGTGLVKGFEQMGKAVGIDNSPEGIEQKNKQREFNVNLEAKRAENELKLAQSRGYQSGYNLQNRPYVPGQLGSFSSLPGGSNYLVEQGLIGATTNRSPTQKVTQGFGLGGTGVSWENINYASSIPGANWSNIEYAGFLPQNEPFANKVIQSLNPTKNVRPYTNTVRESLGNVSSGNLSYQDKLRTFLGNTSNNNNDLKQAKLNYFLGKGPKPEEQPQEIYNQPQVQSVQGIPYQREYYKQEDLPGGVTYPRTALQAPTFAQVQKIPITPTRQDLQMRQQPVYQTPQGYPPQGYPPQGYQPTTSITPEVIPPGRPGQIWSDKSKKWVTYKRSPYGKNKLNKTQVMRQQDYLPQGYPPQGYPPQGYPPQGYPSQITPTY